MCIVITGASSGIGRALALELAIDGHSLVLTGRSGQKLDEIVSDIQVHRPGARVMAFAANLSSPGQTAKLAQQILDAVPGRVRAIAHCAGIGDPASRLQDWQLNDLEAALRVNVLAPFQLTQALLPVLSGSSGTAARVMLLGAGIDRHVQPGTGSYGISKMALRRLFEQWHAEFSQQAGAPLVSLFQPGLVDTPGIRSHLDIAVQYQLPHGNWLSEHLSSGHALTAEQAASALAYTLMDVPDTDFHGTVFRGRDLVDSLFFAGS